MAVSDITIWLLIMLVFNYAIIYRNNRFFGSLGYLLFGIILYGTKEQFGYSEAMYGYIALFIMLGALLGLIYEVLRVFKAKNKPLSKWISRR